jgi:hypothetical protein
VNQRAQRDSLGPSRHTVWPVLANDLKEAAKHSAKVLSMLPAAAELYRRQIAQGLDGDPRAALKARVFLRDWFTGKIRLEPLGGGGLMAHWNQNATALLRNCEHVVAGPALGLIFAPNWCESDSAEPSDGAIRRRQRI